MNSYYTGTTLENWESILKDGMLSVNPPKRVWKEYSEQYIYLIPSNKEKEEGEPFELCIEQSSFAVSAFNGTKRVILEMEGLDESKLIKDTYGPENSVAYPFDIPIENIKSVFIEKHNQSEKIKELIAITHFVQRQKKISCSELEYRYLESDYNTESIYKMVDIPNIELVPIQYLINEEELSTRYLDLIEEVDREVPMRKMTDKTLFVTSSF